MEVLRSSAGKELINLLVILVFLSIFIIIGYDNLLNTFHGDLW